MKLTPAHDYNDFELGTKHHLESLTVIDDQGSMVNVPEQFLVIKFSKMTEIIIFFCVKGIPRFKAREAVTNALKERGLYRTTESHAMVVPICR